MNENELKTNDGIIEENQAKKKVTLTPIDDFSQKLLSAFVASIELQKTGLYSSESIKNSILTVATLLPDQSLANHFRKIMGGHQPTVMTLTAKTNPLAKRQRAKPTPYVIGGENALIPSDLESKFAGEGTNSRFTAKPYIPANQTENLTVPVVVDESGDTTGNEQPQDDSLDSKEFVMPSEFLNGKVTLNDLNDTTPELLADGLKLAELKQIIGELNHDADSFRKKIAAARKIKSIIQG